MFWEVALYLCGKIFFIVYKPHSCDFAVFNLLDLSKKVAIITGGCGHIGTSIADKLSQCGSDLILIDLDQDSLIKSKRRIEGKSRKA